MTQRTFWFVFCSSRFILLSIWIIRVLVLSKFAVVLSSILFCSFASVLKSSACVLMTAVTPRISSILSSYFYMCCCCCFRICSEVRSLVWSYSPSSPFLLIMGASSSAYIPDVLFVNSWYAWTVALASILNALILSILFCLSLAFRSGNLEGLLVIWFIRSWKLASADSSLMFAFFILYSWATVPCEGFFFLMSRTSSSSN